MTTITQLAPHLQTVFTTTADELARATGFVQRQRHVTGSQFAQTTVFGWLSHPNATRQQLHQVSHQVGLPITCTGLDERFTPRAVTFLQALLGHAIHSQVDTSTPLPLAGWLSRFNGVYIDDGTLLSCASQRLKVVARLHWPAGDCAVELLPAHRHDNAATLLQQPLPAGSLRLADLGFFDLKRFATYNQQGVYWLSRYKSGTRLYHPDGTPLHLGDWLPTASDQPYPVLVGHSRVPAYLVAQAVDPQISQQRQERYQQRQHRKQKTPSATTLALMCWTIYLTNIPDLPFAALHVLADRNPVQDVEIVPEGDAFHDLRPGAADV